MSIAYFNGKYLPLSEIKISVLDRGFLFADGVYELIPVYGGKPFRLEQHLDRLDTSLAGIRLDNPLSREQWRIVATELISKNSGREQQLYLHLTRGNTTSRNHLFPDRCSPTVFAMSSDLLTPSDDTITNGARVITLPDIRWEYCSLKTIALLPNVLMRQQAADKGMDEAILIRNGFAMECTTANIFIVESGGLITPPKSRYLLPGITRDLVLELAESNGIPCMEENISEDRLVKADEVWITSSTREIISVTEINGRPIAEGRPGPLSIIMLGIYNEYKAKLMFGGVE